MLCYVSLGVIIDKIDNIYVQVIVTFVMLLILNTIKILNNKDTEIVAEKYSYLFWLIV